MKETKTPGQHKKIPWLLFTILLTLDVVSLLFDKMASNRAAVETETMDFYTSLILQPWLWASLAIGPLQLVTWTKILAKVDLGLGYAISSLHMPLTVLAAVIFLKESPPWHVYLAVAIISVGVTILASEEHAE